MKDKKIKKVEWFGDPTDKPHWWNKNRPLSEKEGREASKIRQNLKNKILALAFQRRENEKKR